MTLLTEITEILRDEPCVVFAGETGDCPFQTFEGAADTVYWYAYLNHKLGLVEEK